MKRFQRSRCRWHWYPVCSLRKHRDTSKGTKKKGLRTICVAPATRGDETGDRSSTTADNGVGPSRFRAATNRIEQLEQKLGQSQTIAVTQAQAKADFCLLNKPLSREKPSRLSRMMSPT